MSGMFGIFDYSKPGPGVSDGGPKRSVLTFFLDIYFRKFWHIIKVNILFFLFNLPAMAMSIVIANIFIRSRLIDGGSGDYIIRLVFGVILTCFPVVTVGPIQAGFAYVLRNYSREEHAFIWGDFIEQARKNIKQGLIVCLIDLFVIVVVGVDINAYFVSAKGSTFAIFMNAFIFLAFVIYLMMHIFIYPMMITFNLNIRQLYRNAFILALGKFIPNLLIMALCVTIITLTFYQAYLGLSLLPFITLGTIGLITNFYAYRIIKKTMIDKAEEDRKKSWSLISSFFSL